LCSTDYNLLKTTNGGVNWVSAYNPVYGYKIQFLNPQTGWVGGSNKIIRTTDGGVTWTPINVNTTGTIYFADAMTGWMVSYNSGSTTIHKTTDGGLNWTPQVSTTDFANIYALKFLDANTGWSAGYREVILKTTNGGTNWIEQRNISGSTGLFSIDFINANTGWIAGDHSSSGSRLLSTTNGGTTWNQSFIGTGSLSSIQFVNSQTGYIAGQYNRVYKTTNLGGITGVSQAGNNNPSEYSLHQNFPNPFNPSTTISFSIAKSGLTKLSVFNYLGQEIAVLKNETMQAGRYEFLFDASNIASGVYYYKLTAGDFTDTKKMILVK
jgi:photosystem II stability/assembly factor-like uncharacterized protein